MNPSRHLLLCAAVGYDWPQLAPFARSLRRTGYAGEVLMLVGPLSAADRRELSAAGITPWRIQPLLSRFPPLVPRILRSRKLARLHAAAAWGCRHAPSAALARFLTHQAVGELHHITCSRYSYYLEFLRRHADRYDRVMTSDVRDVLFQADPFSRPASAPIECYLEDPGSLLGHEFFNAEWLRQVYGEAGLARVADRCVSCSGITYGTVAGMLDYLTAMVNELTRVLPTAAGARFLDQAVHNYLLWTGAWPAARPIENGAGAVFTMHAVPDEEIRVAPTGHLLDPAGRLIPVLHQFDRQPLHEPRLRELLT